MPNYQVRYAIVHAAPTGPGRVRRKGKVTVSAADPVKAVAAARAKVRRGAPELRGDGLRLYAVRTFTPKLLCGLSRFTGGYARRKPRKP